MGSTSSPRSCRLRLPGSGAAADELRGALRSLESALAGLGDICGGDSQGQKFAASYRPNRDAIGRAVANIARGLVSVEDGVRTMAGNYAAVEAANAARMTPGR